MRLPGTTNLFGGVCLKQHILSKIEGLTISQDLLEKFGKVGIRRIKACSKFGIEIKVQEVVKEKEKVLWNIELSKMY